MVGFIRSQLVRRFPRVAALGTGVLVASVGFTLLTSSVDTGALTVQGTIRRNFRPAYDILVRPANSFTPIERSEGLVRANYLSGIYGGISFAQWHEIENIPGVDVAAPIANIGYIMPFTFVPLRINRFLDRQQSQLYRLNVSWLANNGASRYPASPAYVYYERRDPLVAGKGWSAPDEILPDGTHAPVCRTFDSSSPDSGSPFDLRPGMELNCFSSRSPQVAISAGDYGRFPRGYVGVAFALHFPLLISAIDPVQEQRLLDVNSTVVSGKPLTENAHPFLVPVGEGSSWLEVPVLASTRTYVDETLDVSVQRLRTPPPGALIRVLSGKRVRERVSALTGPAVGHIQVAFFEAYRSLLRPRGTRGTIEYSNVWETSAVGYRTIGNDHLIPKPVQNPSSVYIDTRGEGLVPWDNKDVQFRRLLVKRGSNMFVNNVLGPPVLKVVGRFDPAKLPGFSALSQVPLESYYPPSVQPADPASRTALGGKSLLPTQNIGDYIAQPPLLLTTMKGLKPFLDSTNFDPAPHASDPISVIRVRVAGVTGTDPVSLARIQTVASLIHQRTGLAVDITAGSSPHPMLVSLPAGKFGRPPLLLREPWVEKGVAVRFLKALDTKSLILFLLVLVVCVLFLSNAAFAAVRSRRREIGVLLCLGWSKREVFRATLAELGAVGAVAGTVGASIAVVLVRVLDLSLSGWRVIAIVPISILLALFAGFLPARATMAGTPMDAVNPSVVERAQRRRVRGPATMAVANLARLPSRTLVASFGLFIGVGALSTLVAVNAAFSNVLVGTLLGHAISLEIRPVDFLSVALVLGLAGLSVADVLYLNIRERAAELVTLRTSGWRRRDEISLVVLEALGIGTLGSVAGALLGLGVSSVLVHGVGLGLALRGSVIAFVIGLVAALLASVLPAARLGSLTPSVVLAEE